MNTSNHALSTPGAEQVFKFFIRGDSVPRATVTILARDIDVAWGRIQALFPGSDLSDTEVQHRGRH